MRPAALVLALLLASPAAAQDSDVPVPLGVNDTVLGKPEDFRIDGPARVCSNDSGFDLVAGESFYLDYMGIHYARLAVRGPAGNFVITEGEQIAAIKGGKAVAVPGLRVERFGRGRKLRYGIYAYSDFYEEERLLILVSGLSGGPGDVDVLRRIVIKPENASCKRRFLYGMFLSDEGQ